MIVAASIKVLAYQHLLSLQVSQELRPGFSSKSEDTIAASGCSSSETLPKPNRRSQKYEVRVITKYPFWRPMPQLFCFSALLQLPLQVPAVSLVQVRSARPLQCGSRRLAVMPCWMRYTLTVTMRPTLNCSPTNSDPDWRRLPTRRCTCKYVFGLDLLLSLLHCTLLAFAGLPSRLVVRLEQRLQSDDEVRVAPQRRRRVRWRHPRQARGSSATWWVTECWEKGRFQRVNAIPKILSRFFVTCTRGGPKVRGLGEN